MVSNTQNNSSSTSESDGHQKLSSRQIQQVSRALQYVLSPHEYRVVRKKVLLKIPILQESTPTEDQFKSQATEDDEVFSAIRLSTRVFLAGSIGLNLVDAVRRYLAKRRAVQGTVPTPLIAPLHRNANFTFPLSISAILLLHRLLFRFFIKLRSNILSPTSPEFKQRHPRLSKLLSHKFAPSIGASLAGLAFAIGPADERRLTVTIYTLAKALEYLYNRVEDLGYMKNKPWWFGAWLLFPLSSAQLLHSFVFDRDCFPAGYGNAIMGYSKTYVHERPTHYPSHLSWPVRDDTIDGIGEIAHLKYPSFKSPILFPTSSTLPQALSSVSPIIAPAHPGIKQLSCALLHPSEPSCARTFFNHQISEIGRVAKLIFGIYAVLAILQYKTLMKDPIFSTIKTLTAAFKTSSFITTAIGLSWASICALQKVLPGSLLPTQRFYLSGFIGGLAAFLSRDSSSAYFFYSARVGALTWWKAAVKHKRVKPIKGGDVALFVAALATINVLLESSPQAVSGRMVRKGMSVLRGQGWTDPVQTREELLKKQVEVDLAKKGVKSN